MGTARAEDGQGTPTQNGVSPSKLVHVHEESSAVPRGRGAEWRRSAREQGGKAGSSIRKHDHYTPTRQTRRDVRATKARDHPGGRFQQDGGRSRIHILINRVSNGDLQEFAVAATPECWRGSIQSKRGYSRSPPLKTTALKGELTRGDPFLDSGVVGFCS